MSMHEVVTRLRNEHGLTLLQLSKASGVDITTLHKLRSAKYGARPDVAVMLADYLGVSLDELYDRESISAANAGKTAQAALPGQVELELKPCPFCGSYNVNWVPGITGQRYAVECAHCGSQSMEYATKEAAFTAWNKRSKNG